MCVSSFCERKSFVLGNIRPDSLLSVLFLFSANFEVFSLHLSFYIFPFHLKLISSCSVLFFIVLYCIVLYCIVLYCALLCSDRRCLLCEIEQKKEKTCLRPLNTLEWVYERKEEKNRRDKIDYI